VKRGGGRELAAPFSFVGNTLRLIRPAAFGCIRSNPKFRMFHQNALKETLRNR
jgi:hypothetical protein